MPLDPSPTALRDRMMSLLTKTSRSFALSIPAAPAPLDFEIAVAYLLFRIADTFEDSTWVSVAQRRRGLAATVAALANPRCPDARAALHAEAVAVPQTHAGYRELMANTGLVLDALVSLSESAAAIVARHSSRTAEACIDWIGQTDEYGVLRLDSLQELRAYCYSVAGVPGELLCDLFLLECPELASVEDALRVRAPVVGEAMQLVNIVKDVATDAQEDRVFLPATVSLGQAIALARADLEVAREYVQLMRCAGAPAGAIAFHAITTELASAALEVTESRGPGAKIERGEVAEILSRAGVSPKAAFAMASGR